MHKRCTHIHKKTLIDRHIHLYSHRQSQSHRQSHGHTQSHRHTHSHTDILGHSVTPVHHHTRNSHTGVSHTHRGHSHIQTPRYTEHAHTHIHTEIYNRCPPYLGFQYVNFFLQIFNSLILFFQIIF